MKKVLVLFILTGFLIKHNKAQTPPSYTSAEIYSNLLKLTESRSVLYIAAHPDDENTRLLSYLSKEKNYRTAYLSLTRGDGGQNLIGDEQGVELGLIRTQELLAARRIDGAQQFFSRAYDFGYSKSPEEALTIWGRDKILSDVVYIIRYFKPDVIITRFPTTGEGGHGHHTASAILAGEAFEAAGDPKKFPEQLKEVAVWQPKRLLWNTFNFGGNNTIAPDQFRLDVGGYNEVLGKSYGEISAASRSMHKSQGFGATAQRGRTYEFFKPIKGEAPVTDLMDGVIADKTGEAFRSAAKKVAADFDFRVPDKSVPQLIELLKLAGDDQTRTQVKDMLLAAAGIYMEVAADQFINPVTDSTLLHLSVVNRTNTNLKNVSFTIDGVTQNFPLTDSNKNVMQNMVLPPSADHKVSQPYWLENSMDKGSFNLEQKELKDPDAGKRSGIFSFELNNEKIQVEKQVMYKSTDPVKGEVYEPAQFSYPAYINLYPPLILFSTTKNNEEKLLQLSIQGNSVIPEKAPFKLEKTVSSSGGTLGRGNVFTGNVPEIKKGETWRKQIVLKAADFNETTSFVNGTISLKDGADQYFTVRHLKYDHLPAMFYHFQDRAKVLKIDIKTSGKKAGFIYGAGDKIPEALVQLGYEVVELKENDITPEKLSGLDVVVAGVRAYNTREWLPSKSQIINNYVEKGGVYFVQYNTSTNFSPLSAAIFPFDFSITRNRITDEYAAVTIKDKNNVVFNYPNKITNKDFDGWVQERSIYQGYSADRNFSDLIEMKDAGETATGGSLMVANYGKGRFVYSGLTFFRQLPSGVGGAYRLFANLIAKPN